jgi:hypothetical protein
MLPANPAPTRLNQTRMCIYNPCLPHECMQAALTESAPGYGGKPQFVLFDVDHPVTGVMSLALLQTLSGVYYTRRLIQDRQCQANPTC